MENIIQSIPMTTFDTATLVGTNYSVLNATGLDEACFMIRIINNSNIDITISRDAGATAMECVQSNDTFQLGSFNDRTLAWSKGSKFQIRNSAAAGGAGAGLVFLSGYYR